MTNRLTYWIAALFLGLTGCKNDNQHAHVAPRFTNLPADSTGITFSNNLTNSLALNIFSYLYFYNGGGVATGDLNGDGLVDLYFTANQESNTMYLNKGDFKFEDITAQSGTAGQKGWTTGVTMADVNGDGRLDLYVSQVGDYQNIRGKNQLYINLGNSAEGIPMFEDQAAQWGLDLVGFSTQAAFFDYDLDGDLDMYMLNHSLHSQGTFGRSTKRNDTHPLSGDKLMRNDGNTFTEVTAESGIYSSVLGYGLGIGVGDINLDGYPDIYIGNDFHENDYLYLNNGDGTFTESLESLMGHTSRFSMGNDINDFNNDGFPDILSLDMLPEDPVRLKASAAEDPYDIFHFKLNYGYNHQYARNTLQLNMGNNHFSEVGMLAGIYATDWSWSGFIVDLDLDGLKDFYIANGVKRRSNDMDYINFVSNDAVQYRLEGDLREQDLKLIEKMPVELIPNFAFQNLGGLKFKDVGASWGLNDPSFSNGAAYADLDNDGDLDLIVNNIDTTAFIYRNNTINATQKDNHYLKAVFKGSGKNTQGIGAKLILKAGGQTYHHELYTTRGYQSSVAPELIIGIGQNTLIDTLWAIWPGGHYETQIGVAANQTLVFDEQNAQGTYTYKKLTSPAVFKDWTDSLQIDYEHKENRFVEFTREPLLPHMNATEGPKLAVGDVNGDGLEDFFVGGAKRQPGKIFLQTKTGFTALAQPAFRADSTSEDIGAVLFDADMDGDLDLAVASGGNEFRGESVHLMPRLYINDGQGVFERDTARLPQRFLTASCIVTADYDQDGDLDLFVGGRAVPWQYGEKPQSYLFQNDGKGFYKDVTSSVKGLSEVGFVKAAVWADFDGNGAPDLALAGDWMPITIFYNQKGSFKVQTVPNTHGWWNCLYVVDMNKDGFPDLAAGNLGLNSKLKANAAQPINMYVADFDKNGSLDQLLCYFDKNGEERLFATRDEITAQLTMVKKKFVKYTGYAQASLSEIIPQADLQKATKYYAENFASGICLNDGKGGFQFNPFPNMAQTAPINAFASVDHNKDGYQDLIAVGNYYEANIQRGRYDASYGYLLANQQGRSYAYTAQPQSGLHIVGQSRDIKPIILGKNKIWLVTKNNGPIQVITSHQP